MDKNKDHIIRKKSVSIFLTISILLLVVAWISIVFVGVLNEFEAETVKALNGKKVVFLLDETIKESKPLEKKDEVKNEVGETRPVSLVLKLPENMDIKEIAELVPENINIAISTRSKNFGEINKELADSKLSYLIKLPISKKSDENELTIYPHIDKNELTDRLKKLTDGTNAIGVYHEGSDEFVMQDLVSFANIISFLNENNLLLLYGVNGETTVFESDKENIFSVEACDKIINADKNLKEDIIKSIEKSKNSDKLILMVELSNKPAQDIIRLVDIIKSHNIKLVPINQLPKSISTANG